MHQEENSQEKDRRGAGLQRTRILILPLLKLGGGAGSDVGGRHEIEIDSAIIQPRTHQKRVGQAREFLDLLQGNHLFLWNDLSLSDL